MEWLNLPSGSTNPTVHALDFDTRVSTPESVWTTLEGVAFTPHEC